MRLSVKRIYCDRCQRLVRGRVQAVDGNTGVFCCRCSRLLRVWDGMRWRYAPEGG